MLSWIKGFGFYEIVLVMVYLEDILSSPIHKHGVLTSKSTQRWSYFIYVCGSKKDPGRPEYTYLEPDLGVVHVCDKSPVYY